MALHVIKVSLATNAGKATIVLTPTFCEVDSDSNNVSRIIWTFGDHGTDARFVLPADGSDKPFNWLGSNDLAIFDDDATVSADGKILLMADRHIGDGTIRDQYYALRVKTRFGIIETARHETCETHEHIRIQKHPVIINR